jgi:hypothetical protein
MTEAQAAATRFCARVVGPFLIIFAAMIFVRYESFPELLPQVMQNTPLVLVTGLLTCILGLVWLTAHHHFGSPAAIVLTVLAALLTLRGAVLMVAPQLIFGIAENVSRTPVIMLVTTTVALLLGCWLTFVGWFAARP